MEWNITKPKVIAEIGATHIGCVDRAKELIKLAYFCGCDYVKFQKRNPIESTPKELKNKKHPNELFSYGATYLEHRQKLELNIKQHVELFEYCNTLGIKYATSVWDMTSAKEVIENINLDYIKIPSACNLNFDLIKYVYNNFYKEIHISTGMIHPQELEKLVDFLKTYICSERIVLYHCTSEYPCSFEHIYLNSLLSLKGMGFITGFSNHGYGIATDIAAMMYGVKYIERHFTNDRLFRHSDSAASLEPDGMQKLCRDLKNVYRTLSYKDNITAEEVSQRNKLSLNKFKFLR